MGGEGGVIHKSPGGGHRVPDFGEKGFAPGNWVLPPSPPPPHPYGVKIKQRENAKLSISKNTFLSI